MVTTKLSSTHNTPSQQTIKLTRKVEHVSSQSNQVNLASSSQVNNEDSKKKYSESDTSHVKLISTSSGHLIGEPIIRIDAPSFTQVPEDLSYIFGTAGHNLTWEATDSQPNTYTIYRNGSTVDSGSWEDLVPITIIVDGLQVGTYNYTIELIGKFSQVSYDTAFVYVTEDNPPVFVASPKNTTYIEDSTGNKLAWNVTDEFPDYYRVYRNGTFIKEGSWMSYSNISINIDGLLHNTYNFTLVVQDDFLNKAFHSVFVEVIDQSNPLVSISPPDLSYPEGSSGNILSWTLTDNNPTIFKIFKNSTQLVSSSWSSENPIEINIDGLPVAVYNYTIQAYDKAGNFVVDTAYVTVEDNSPPVITLSPANFSYAEGTTGNSISWEASDDNPGTYRILRNGTQIDSGTWLNQSPISINIDGLNKANYNFTIEFFDTSSLQAIDTVFVTVIDTTPPIFVTSPSDSNYSEGATGNQLVWNSTDNYPDTYSIYQDGILVQTGSWTNLSNITINIDSLFKGSYNFTIIVTDHSGNFMTDTVIVIVLDTVVPVIESFPSDYSYNEDSVGNTLTWNATDKYPSTYSIYQNASFVSSSSWSNATSVMYNIDGLLKGQYNFTIVFFDESSNWIAHTVWITVFDNIAPAFVLTPGNITYVETSIGNQLNWTAEDHHPSSFTIYRNGLALFTSAWQSNSVISINIDGLSTGSYNFTIIVRDESLNANVDTSWVNVIDTHDPVFSTTPDDTSYSLGTTGHFLEWVGVDNHPDTYVIFQNSSQIKTGSWVSSGTIQVNIDGLSVGPWNYTIIIYDASGNYAKDIAIVTVANIPVFTEQPEELAYTLGETGNVLSWTMSDSNPDKYIITRNGTHVNNGTWGNEIPVTINVDGLGLGVYNYTIQVNDTDNNIVFDWVLVEVSDIPQWVLPLPSDIVFSEGTTDNTLSWNATDTSPNFYEIYKNGSLLDTGTWSNATLITINLDTFVKGSYNVQIRVYDKNDNMITDEVMVTVTDDTSPVFIDPPSDILYSEGSLGNSISWNVSDTYPNYYEIYFENGSTPIQIGSWNSYENISINIDGLLKGSYNYTLIVYDASNNTNQSIVIVTVQDRTNPFLTLIPGDLSFPEGSMGHVLQWNASDNYPDYYEIYIDQSFEESGSWSVEYLLTKEVDGLSEGVYNYTIVFYDQSGNWISDMVLVEVTDIPVILESTPTPHTYSEGTQGNHLIWNASDSYPDNYIVYLNDNPYTSSSWADKVNITINIDDLAKGTYNFTIILFDTANNLVVGTIIVDVIDTTTPVWQSSSGNITYSEYVIGNQIYWSAIDNYPDFYEIYFENGGVPIQTGSWFSTEIIALSVDGHLKGTYNYTIIFYDLSGNKLVDTIFVEVVDTEPPDFDFVSSDFSFLEGSTGNTIKFNMTDSYPGMYDIYQDSKFNTTGSWNNGEIKIHSVDGLSRGLYNFTIIIYDASNNSNSHTVWVRVVEIDPPIIISEPPGTIQIQESLDSYILEWQAEDVYPDFYEIWINDVFNATLSGNWDNQTIISFDIGNYIKGIYNCTIIFFDTSLNNVTSTSIIEVIDATFPIFNQIPPGSVEFSEGDNVDLLDWEGFDRYPDEYIIYRNHALFDTSDWIANLTYSLNVSNFPKGTYNLTVVFYDESGNTNSFTTWIFVYDTTYPNLVTIPSDVTYMEDTTGNYLIWEAEDRYPNTYQLFRNGTFVQGGSWSSSNALSINVDNLSKGYYNYTILLSDESGNQISHTVFVSIYDGTSPELISLEYPSVYTEETTQNTISWVANEKYPRNYVLYQNSTLIASGQWISELQEIISIDGLLKGYYRYNLTIFDDSLNAVSVPFDIMVVDTKHPELLSHPGNFTHEEDKQELIIEWMVFDNYPHVFFAYMNGKLINKQNWNNDEMIQLVLSNLIKGEYNLTILFYDKSLNQISSTHIISVIDVTPPQITTSPGNVTVFSNTNGNDLFWTVNDRHPRTYVIEKDGSLFISDIWNTQTISLNVDNFAIGIYNITLILLDESDLKIKETIFVRIKDPQTTDTLKPTFSLISQVYEGDVEKINLTWRDENQSAIAYSQLSLELINSNTPVKTQLFPSNSDGQFSVVLNYTGLDPGEYLWEFNFEKYLYQNHTIIKKITILPHQVSIKIEAKQTLERGKSFDIYAIVTYNNSNEQQSGLGLNQYIPKTGYAVGVEISFTIEFLDMNNNPSRLTKQAVTQLNGVAQLRLSSDETQNIKELNSISASITNDVTFTSQTVDLENPPQAVNNELDAVSLIVAFVEIWWIYITLVFTIILLISLFFYRIKSLRKRFVDKILNDLLIAESELKSLRSIQALMIQTNSGLPLYEQQIKEFGVDSILISGLSNAISSFLTELDKEETFGFEIIERDTISITSHKGELSSFILVSSKRISLVVLDQIKRTHKLIEKRFETHFTEGRRGYDLLPVDQIEKTFAETGFKIFLTRPLYIQTQRIHSIQRFRAISRILRQKMELFHLFAERNGANAFTLGELIEFFETQGLRSDMIARMIILAYSNHIIKGESFDEDMMFSE